MSPDDRPDDTNALVRLYLRLSLVNVLLIGCTALFFLWLWLDLGEARRILADIRGRTCTPRIIRAETPVRPDDDAPGPPENYVRTGYVGDGGIRLPTDVLMTKLDARRDGSDTRLRFGDAAVLRPRGVHVINLWAGWCKPCREELPGLKSLLADHQEAWADVVEFIPIKVLDDENAAVAYERYADLLPSSPIQLADRSSGDDLVSALRADPTRELFHGKLPVTLVLDCNRRVRWIQFNQLYEPELADLARTLDRLVAEARDLGPLSHCAQEPWCGDGRCDAGERTTGRGTCPVDCGEITTTRSVATVEPAPAPTPLPTPSIRREAPPCPKDCARCDGEGTCLARLQRSKDDPPSTPAPAQTQSPCGDGVCDPAIGENNYACCLDCACDAPLTCQPATAGKHHCRATIR